MLASTCAPYPAANGTASFDVGAGGVTEPTTKFPCEMSIVAKAAGVGDLAERLVSSQ
jgi:hypothetical protein